MHLAVKTKDKICALTVLAVDAHDRLGRLADVIHRIVLLEIRVERVAAGHRVGAVQPLLQVARREAFLVTWDVLE